MKLLAIGVLAAFMNSILVSSSGAGCVTCTSINGKAWCEAGTVAERCATFDNQAGCEFSGHRDCGRDEDDIPHQSKATEANDDLTPSLDRHEFDFRLAYSTTGLDRRKHETEYAEPPAPDERP